jgi:hypothetical protein
LADLVITAANVLKGAGSTVSNGRAGGTVTAGQPVYQDAADANDWKPCDADASAAASAAIGIALHAAEDGQPLQILVDGPITIGATVAVGTIYITSDTAGGIRPSADVDSADWVTILGVATSTTVIQININASGAQVP